MLLTNRIQIREILALAFLFGSQTNIQKLYNNLNSALGFFQYLKELREHLFRHTEYSEIK